MSENPDAYLHNEDGKPPAVPATVRRVPWNYYESFLAFLVLDSPAAQEAWTNAPEAVHNIFFALLVDGCGPFAAATLFVAGYCAPHGTFVPEDEPDYLQDLTPPLARDCQSPDPGPCTLSECPQSFCARHPNFVPSDAPGSSYDGRPAQ